MVKYLTRTIKISLLLFAAALIAVMVWLRQDVRSLERARPWITQALNSPDAPYVVKFGEASIDWRDWAQFGLLQITHVEIAGHDGTVFASLPALYVSFDPVALISGRRSLNTILLYKPKLFFTRDASKIVRLGVDNENASIPVASIAAFLSAGDSGEINLSAPLPFRRMIIDRAVLNYTDAVTNSTLTSASASFKLARKSGAIDAVLDLPFSYNGTNGDIEATVRSFSEEREHVLNMLLTQVPAQLGCMVTQCNEGIEPKGMINGKFSLTLDDAASPVAGGGALTFTDMVITAPDIFAEPLLLSKATLEATASEHMKNIQLTQLALGLADTEMEITGNASERTDGWYVNIDAKGKKPLDVTKLYKYWPLPLAPDSRTWVLGSMKAGHGDAMSLKLALTPEDFTAPTLRDAALAANLTARNITVEYLPGFPLMKNVNANVHFTGETIVIDATSGNSLSGTVLGKGKIAFPDLNKAGTPMEIAVNLQAPATDAATILALKYFTFDDALQLNPASIKGQVDAAIDLKFDAFSADSASTEPKVKDEIDFTQVVYDITTNLRDIAQDQLAGKINVSQLSGELKATNAGMNLTSSVMLGGTTPLNLSAKQQSGGDVQLGVSGTIGRAQLLQLGMPDSGYVGEGSIKLTAQAIARKTDLLIEKAEIDLTDLAIDIPELSWSKKRGTSGNITVSSAANKGATEYRVDVKADDLAISNAALALDKSGGLARVAAPSIKTAQNDFAATYQTQSEGYAVSLIGKRLNASASYAKTGGGLLKNFPAIQLTIDLAELILDPAQPFSQLKGQLQCSTLRCESANIQAKAGKSNITGAIQRKQGQRTLEITASNAGDFLRAVGFTDRLYDGTLDIVGTYDDAKSPPLFVGNAWVLDFKLKNSAILGRILSIGSLTGLQNALTGDGIAFNKLTASIGQQAGVIVVKDGKANGTAMGITTGGTIDTNEATLKLKGVVVPAYALNSLLGKIPVIGALAGGDGEGLIAFNYSVNGTYDNPDVSVNPLSGLTPGFLRGIFGVFDSKEKKPAAKPEVKPEVTGTSPASEAE